MKCGTVVVFGEWDSLGVLDKDRLVVCEVWDCLVVCGEWDGLIVLEKGSVWSV